MSLERDIARAARELLEERRIERQLWRKVHRHVLQLDRRPELTHNRRKARKQVLKRVPWMTHLT